MASEPLPAWKDWLTFHTLNEQSNVLPLAFRDASFAFNGTAANALALAAMCQSYHAVICTVSSHVETAECGAPEFFSNGSKLLTVRTEGGKLTPEAIRRVAD